MQNSTSPDRIDNTEFEQKLKRRLHRATCPSTLELGEYEQEMLAADDHARIDRHLHTCPICRKELAFLRTFFAVELVADMVTETPLETTPQSPGLFQRIVAQLQTGLSAADAFAPMAGAVLRGNGELQHTYEAAGFLIMLDIQPIIAAHHRFLMTGLVLGDQEPMRATVALLMNAEQIAQTELDDAGNFSFSDLTTGTYSLLITSGTTEVQIPELTI